MWLTRKAYVQQLHEEEHLRWVGIKIGRKQDLIQGIWESDDESMGSSIDKIDPKQEQKQLVN